MRTSIMTCLACVVMLAGCSDASEPQVITGEPEPLTMTESTLEEIAAEPAPSTPSPPRSNYIIPQNADGWSWFVSDRYDFEVTAYYGAENTSAYGGLFCSGESGGSRDRELMVSIPELESHNGRETATIQSGDASETVSTIFNDDGMTMLYAPLKRSGAVSKNIPEMGFVVAFPNGEQFPFPPEKALNTVTDFCAP